MRLYADKTGTRVKAGIDANHRGSGYCKCMGKVLQINISGAVPEQLILNVKLSE